MDTIYKYDGEYAEKREDVLGGLVFDFNLLLPYDKFGNLANLLEKERLAYIDD